MAITIITTVGGATSNSYATVAEGDSYFEARPDSAWITATDTLKKAALVTAARQFDTLSWVGTKINIFPEGHASYQSLAWPRGGREWWKDEGLPYSYNSSGTLIVPQEIKWAQLEQANYLLTSGGLGDTPERIRMQQEGVRGFAVPGLSETLSGNPRGLYSIGAETLRLIKKYLVDEGIRLVRG
jgi:hypothetical protein